MKFHFMVVVYPVKPGISASREIKWLDKFTVEVTSGAEKDVISFNPQTRYQLQATIIIDLSAMTPLSMEE